MLSPLRLVALAAAISLSAPTAALATDYSWNNATTGAGSGTWSTPSNWLPNTGSPGALDSVISPTLTGAINVNILNPQVTNWTHNIGTGQDIFANTSGIDPTLTISGTLTQSGAAGVLTFRNSSRNLSLNVGSISVSGGTLALGGTPSSSATNPLTALSGGSATVSGGSLALNVSGAAAITGTISQSGTGGFYLAQSVGATGRTVSVGALSSASTTAVVAANSFASSISQATLALTAGTGSTTYAGIVRNGASTSSVAIQKTGAGTQIFSGNGNIYNGGTTISAGELLVTNTSGSGTGTGAVVVNGGKLGGTGLIAPSGINGVTVAHGGFIAAGTGGIGQFRINLGVTTGGVDLTSGGDFQFELGTVNASISSIAAGSSDLLTLTGAAASDVSFGGGNVIDLLGTATATGYYRLFDTSLNQTTWTGLTLGGSTTGGTLITGGLSATNFGGGFSGNLILGDGTASTQLGDIYLQIIPEPTTTLLLGLGLGLLSARRRRG